MQLMCFTGRFAAEPVLTTRGDTTRCNFTLIDNSKGKMNEATGKRREYKTALPFVAFGPLAITVAENFRKGCQMFASFEIRNNNYDKGAGEIAYNYDFVLDGFEFGAPGPVKRAELAARAADGQSHHDDGHEQDAF